MTSTFDNDQYQFLVDLYGFHRGSLAFRYRNMEQFDYDLSNKKGRMAALFYLYFNLPWDVFLVIFNLVFADYALHPIIEEQKIDYSTSIITRDQQKISGRFNLIERHLLRIRNVLFFRMFHVGLPSDYGVMLHVKNYPEPRMFCLRCGEPTLILRWSSCRTNCNGNLNCRHPHGNYRCIRYFYVMGDCCAHCQERRSILFDQEVNVHHLGTFGNNA